MNPVLEQMKNHRSIRKYKDIPIEEETIQTLIEAAMNASSSGNMQSFSIIVTKNRDLRQELLPYHFDQRMVLEAPVFVTFCADFNRTREWLKMREAPLNFDNPMSFMIGAIDAILASQNFSLAAESLGLGVCYLGTTLASCGEIARLLDCPKNVVPVVGMCLGYPDEKPQKRRRLPQKYLTHQEKYHQYSQEELSDCYDKREFEAQQRLDFKCKSDYAKFLTTEKYTRESHLKYSYNLLKTLQEKNFLKCY